MPKFKQVKQDLEDSGFGFDPTPQQSEEGLVPLGDSGIYTSPDKPIASDDCRFYPNSPLCGGNPLDARPIGLDTELIFDECNIGFKATGVVGFTKLPTHEIVYRQPECREPPPEPPPKEPPLPPPPPKPPSKPDEKYCLSGKFELFAIEELNLKYSERTPYTLGLQQESALSAYNAAFLNSTNISEANEGYPEGWKTETLPGGAEIIYRQAYLFFNKELYSNKHVVECYATYTSRIVYMSINDNDPDNPGNQFTGSVSTNYELIDPLFPDCPPVSNEPPGIPDPPPPPEPCMPCCCNPGKSDKDRNLERLLRVLLQRVGVPTAEAPSVLKAEAEILRRIGLPKQKDSTVFKKLESTEEFLGIAKMPAKFPKRLIYPNGEGEVEQENLLDILDFQIRQIDRSIGYLPQKIEVTDTNPAKPGNQSISIEVHSLADIGRETLKYLADVEGDGDTTNNMLVRCLYELGFIHQGVVQADAMLDAICNFLDFKENWKSIDVPFAFDPRAGQKGKIGKGFGKQENSKNNNTEEEVENLLPKLLQNTIVKIRVLNNQEKKTLCDRLQDIKRDTAIAAAAVSEPASSGHLQKVVEATQAILQLQSAINRKDARQAMSSGDYRTRKNKK